MLAYDFSPLLRTAIGFDRLARQAEAAVRYDDATSYPPYNIESTGEDRYRITLAVAGFIKDELEIEVVENTLVISGRKEDRENGSVYLYKGIAARHFTRKFELADHVFAQGANLSDGLLTIDLKREIPEEKKPRQIEISVASPVVAMNNCAVNSH